MIIIADASPIISLVLVEQIQVLEKLFPEYLIPSEVYRELEYFFYRREQVDVLNIFKSKTREVSNPERFPELEMDKGERECIILYYELGADAILIDDKEARNAAESLNIKCIGTLGILITARNMGLIPMLYPVFQKLRSNNRFYSKDLMNSILRDKGEEELL